MYIIFFINDKLIDNYEIFRFLQNMFYFAQDTLCKVVLFFF